MAVVYQNVLRAEVAMHERLGHPVCLFDPLAEERTGSRDASCRIAIIGLDTQRLEEGSIRKVALDLGSALPRPAMHGAEQPAERPGLLQFASLKQCGLPVHMRLWHRRHRQQ